MSTIYPHRSLTPCRIALTLLQSILVAACGNPNGPSADDPQMAWVSKTDFEAQGLKWPLTVDKALIGCTDPVLLWVEANGQRYGINGMGQTHLRLERFDPIWAIDPSYPEVEGQDRVKITATDLLEEAKKLCPRQI